MTGKYSIMNAQEHINIVRVNCPLCQSDKTNNLLSGLYDVEDNVPGLYAVSRCLNCEFVYLSLRPDSDSLSRCYRKHYHSRRGSRRGVVAERLYGIRARMRFRRLLEVLDEPPKSVLEIGCGDAGFLTLLESVWGEPCRLVGVDLDTESIDLPSNSHIQLIQGNFETARIEGPFELVLMYGVLEHIRQPLEVLRTVCSLLCPGGLLVGQVPKWGCFWQRVFPRHWAGLQVPRHQSFFEPNSLNGVLVNAGFTAGPFREVFDPGDLSVSLTNWIADRFRLRTPARQAWFYVPLALACAPVAGFQTFLLRLSGSMEFVARRPDKKTLSYS